MKSLFNFALALEVAYALVGVGFFVKDAAQPKPQWQQIEGAKAPDFNVQLTEPIVWSIQFGLPKPDGTLDELRNRVFMAKAYWSLGDLESGSMTYRNRAVGVLDSSIPVPGRTNPGWDHDTMSYSPYGNLEILCSSAINKGDFAKWPLDKKNKLLKLVHRTNGRYLMVTYKQYDDIIDLLDEGLNPEEDKKK